MVALEHPMTLAICSTEVAAYPPRINSAVATAITVRSSSSAASCEGRPPACTTPSAINPCKPVPVCPNTRYAKHSPFPPNREMTTTLASPPLRACNGGRLVLSQAGVPYPAVQPATTLKHPAPVRTDEHPRHVRFPSAAYRGHARPRPHHQWSSRFR